MKYIKQNPGFGYKYGSAVCEQQLEFLKGQTPLVHQVVRLAKFWNKTLNIGTYISGRSTMIELIGIHAGRIQEELGQRSHLEGFKKFLDLISKFDTLCVKFCEIYKEDEIPDDVNRQLPLVLDPVNMYNNFAYFTSKEKAGIIRKFKEFADETLKRLTRYPIATDMNQLFEVQPKKYVGEVSQPQKWFVDILDKKMINPTMKINMDGMKFKEKNWNVKDVQQCLMTAIAAASLGGDGRGLSMEEVKKKVQNCVDINILGLPYPRYWNNYRCCSTDVTLSIPIPGNPNKSFELSVSW